MAYLPDHAAATPDKPAMISADTGDVVTFRELNDRSNQLAQLLHARGLRRGDHLAVLMENNLRFYDPVWAAFRSGLYLTTVNRYLPPDEAAYIINDCGAQAIVTSYAKRETAEGLNDLIPNCKIRLMVGGTIPGLGILRGRDRDDAGRAAGGGVDRRVRCSIAPAPPAGRRASCARCRR